MLAYAIAWYSTVDSSNVQHMYLVPAFCTQGVKTAIVELPLLSVHAWQSPGINIVVKTALQKKAFTFFRRKERKGSLRNFERKSKIPPSFPFPDDWKWASGLAEELFKGVLNFPGSGLRSTGRWCFPVMPFLEVAPRLRNKKPCHT